LPNARENPGKPVRPTLKSCSNRLANTISIQYRAQLFANGRDVDGAPGSYRCVQYVRGYGTSIRIPTLAFHKVCTFNMLTRHIRLCVFLSRLRSVGTCTKIRIHICVRVHTLCTAHCCKFPRKRHYNIGTCMYNTKFPSPSRVRFSIFVRTKYERSVAHLKKQNKQNRVLFDIAAVQICFGLPSYRIDTRVCIDTCMLRV